MRGYDMATRIMLFLLVFFVGCQASNELDTGPIILTDPSEVMVHIGEIVTIRGVVTNSKIPQIIGVDVHSENPDLRGTLAEATGVLNSWTVTKAQLEESDRLYGPIANRGPGLFVRLKALDSNYDAPVCVVSP
jgi:hypothetical protein